MVAATDEIVMHAVPGTHELPEELVKIPDFDARRVEASLDNSRWHGRWGKYVLFNGHYLECFRRGSPPRVVNLSYLSVEPVVQRESAWPWLCVSIVAAAGASLTAAFAQVQETVALAAVSLLVFVGFLINVHQRLIFRTRTGGIALFEVPVGLFNRKAVLAFVDTMQTRIEGAGAILPVGEGRLAAEMAEHRRLFKEGWLSQARYELAKKRIFSRYRKSGN